MSQDRPRKMFSLLVLLAMLAALGVMAAREAKVHQGIEIRVGNGKHMATAPAIAAIGPTELLVLFVSE